MNIKTLLNNSSLTKTDPQTQLSQWATSKITKGVASTVSQLLNNSGLTDKVYEFAKVMRDIKISIIEEENKVELSIFEFPLTPSTIIFNDENIIETAKTINGQINYIKDRDFNSVSFSCFFPSVYYPFSDNYKAFGIKCVDIINKLKANEKPLKLVITGIGIVRRVYVSRFTYNTTPCGDIEYSIEFTEARTPEIYESDSKTYSFKPKSFNLSR